MDKYPPLCKEGLGEIFRRCLHNYGLLSNSLSFPNSALPAGGVVADIGVGTGLSAEPFLAAGYGVIGVEPNGPMRAAGDEFLARYPRYRSVQGAADATGLADRSVDLVIAAQAFH